MKKERSHKHKEDTRENQWNFIELYHLNRSGLHLSIRTGTAALAQNSHNMIDQVIWEYDHVLHPQNLQSRENANGKSVCGS